MTDAEVICEWMEPKPANSDGLTEPLDCGWMSSPGGWWVEGPRGEAIQPRDLALDALWEVEERLIRLLKGRWLDLEYREYRAYEGKWDIGSAKLPKDTPLRWIWHADAPTRITALAAVLRPLVEGAAK